MSAGDVLEVRGVSKRFGRTVTAADISLSIGRGEFFTFLGPSGSGKSTLLRMIAGLERPDAGEIRINGEDMATVPPWKRDLGMMFQSYALFPHLDVRRNVMYGLRMHGVGRREAAARAEEMLALVGLSRHASAHPTRMSGGEQQRVALARALAPRPKILLLDEPLSALDEKIRRQMQEQLKAIQGELKTTFVYVTHDQEEALTMSDRVAVFNEGRCLQVDEPHVLHRRPRTRFVAQFFRGSNIVSARIAGAAAEGRVRLEIGGAAAEVAGQGAGRAQVNVALRAEHVLIGAPAEEAVIRWQGKVGAVRYRGANTDYEVEVEPLGRLLATTVSRTDFAVGQAVPVGVRAEDVVLLED